MTAHLFHVFRNLCFVDLFISYHPTFTVFSHVFPTCVLIMELKLFDPKFSFSFGPSVKFPFCFRTHDIPAIHYFVPPAEPSHTPFDPINTRHPITDEYKPKEKGKYIEWYQFKNPFRTIIDGLSGDGKILAPKSKNNVKMDEKDSTGI